MKSGWITHQGKDLFFCRYGGMTYEELKEEIDAVDDLISQLPEASLLILTDVKGTTATPKVVDLFKKSTAITKKHIKKSATIGIGLTGPRKMLFDLVMKFSGQHVILFDDVEEAKDWLVSDKAA